MMNNRIKRVLAVFVLFCGTITACLSQTLDGYKYLFLPPLTYTDGSIDKWGVAEKVSQCFQRKGFVVANYVSELPDNKTSEYRSVLICNIQHSADMCDLCTNTVTITLTNVFRETVLTLSGKSQGLHVSLQGELGSATRNALSSIERMRYSFDPQKSPRLKFPEVEKTSWTEQTIKQYLDTCANLASIEGIYKSVSTKTNAYYKLGIVKDGDLFKAIIIESEYDHWEPGEVKAIFEKANMSLYSVRFYMANKTALETFATYESRGVLKVDFSKIEGANNSEFIKLYPIQQSSSPRPSSKPSSNYIASGTGFIISKDGYIATNAHVIDGSNRVTVDMLKDDKVVQYEAEVVVTDVANDVAIIKIVDDAFTAFNKLPYTIEPNINIGADVYTIGFPLNDVMGTNYKVTNGIISAKTGIDDDIRYYQITVPIQPGNSGGPLINRNGNVVGLTTSRLNGNAVGTKVENVNYAIKSLYLLNVINMVPNMDDLPSASSIANMNMEEQIVVLKNYVCLIKIY